MIRDKNLLLNGWLLAQAKIAAELDQTDCVETWIESVLRAALDLRPELADLVDMRAAARKAADAAWKAKHGQNAPGAQNLTRSDPSSPTESA